MSQLTRVTLGLALLTCDPILADDKPDSHGPVAHWNLTQDGKDRSGHGHHGIEHGVTFGPTGAVFDGIDDYLRVPDTQSLGLGTADFSSPNPNLDNQRPLLIGFGQHDYFQGTLRDLRIYRRALTTNEIQALASPNR